MAGFHLPPYQPGAGLSSAAEARDYVLQGRVSCINTANLSSESAFHSSLSGSVLLFSFIRGKKHFLVHRPTRYTVRVLSWISVTASQLSRRTPCLFAESKQHGARPQVDSGSDRQTDGVDTGARDMGEREPEVDPQRYNPHSVRPWGAFSFAFRFRLLGLSCQPRCKS